MSKVRIEVPSAEILTSDQLVEWLKANPSKKVILLAEEQDTNIIRLVTFGVDRRFASACMRLPQCEGGRKDRKAKKKEKR